MTFFLFPSFLPLPPSLPSFLLLLQFSPAASLGVQGETQGTYYAVLPQSLRLLAGLLLPAFSASLALPDGGFPGYFVVLKEENQRRVSPFHLFVETEVSPHSFLKFNLLG